MAPSYNITVRYNATNGNLNFESAEKRQLILAPNTSPIHSLVWSFEGIDGLVAAGWTPAVQFVLAPHDRIPKYSGPFTNLTRTTSSVIASGNTGHGGKYSYYAVLQPPVQSDLPEIRTARAHLFNEVPEPIFAVIKVRFPTAGEKLLRVEPEVVTCTPGQMLLWEVEEPPKDIGEWHPKLVFVDGPDEMNSHFGPFTSLDTRDQGILASGSAGHPGRYKYVFQMVNVKNGKVRYMSSPDPIVDDQGDPTGGGNGPVMGVSRTW